MSSMNSKINLSCYSLTSSSCSMRVLYYLGGGINSFGGPCFVAEVREKLLKYLGLVPYYVL